MVLGIECSWTPSHACARGTALFDLLAPKGDGSPAYKSIVAPEITNYDFAEQEDI